jgi:hypothetical protein
MWVIRGNVFSFLLKLTYNSFQGTKVDMTIVMLT